jgi:hypothetical protein
MLPENGMSGGASLDHCAEEGRWIPWPKCSKILDAGEAMLLCLSVFDI